ncbi:MAG: hypothetical protein CL927_01115 [Deltaproteobacteria bacterium]|nr:hypothetical protein [Deltaproteobacteria bacterium]HCH61748.1 hypothetical protein [Deltaproteobacteria bacterium]
MFQRAKPSSYRIPRFAFPEVSQQDWGWVTSTVVVLLSGALIAELSVGPGSTDHGVRLFAWSSALVCLLALELMRQGAGGAVPGLAPAEQLALVRALQCAPGTPVPIEGRVQVRG